MASKLYSKIFLSDASEKRSSHRVNRDALLHEHDIDRNTIHNAWFIMAHLLLNNGSHVVHMGCKSGALTFAMATLYPHIQFTGFDKDRQKIHKANALYELDNLNFKIGDASSGLFGSDTLDAIIDDNFLHVIYSQADYSEAAVSEALVHHHRMLKKNGQLFLRDYACPAQDEFVLLEMPDIESKSDDLVDLSDADLLIWYSENARPSEDFGYSGFFLEELPPSFPNTRLFRLPHKWAYEFIMRKDEREKWDEELPTEYSFFSPRELRNALKQLGMRVPYAASYSDESIVSQKFEGKFRLYNDDGAPLDYPAQAYIAIGIKIDEKHSLQVSERRPSHNTDNNNLTIETLQNEKTGALVEIVKQSFSVSEILPYRITEDGELKVFLHHGLVRSIINAVPRTGGNISDHRYSGHMVEAITVNSNDIPDDDLMTDQSTSKFAQEHLDLKPLDRAVFEKGPHYYPAPDFIDERIQTYFLPVQKSKKSLIEPLKQFISSYRFTEKGAVQEFDAQQILDAISIGLIPNVRLELQILALYEHLKIRPENWTQKEINFQVGKAIQHREVTAMFDPEKNDIAQFSKAKTQNHNLRSINSIFVEEGQARGATAGLSYEDVNFVIHHDNTENIAVVLPLSQDVQGDVNAAFFIDNMPVPARHEGSGLSVMAPKYPLPPEIKNLRMAKKYLAERFSVQPEHVIKMGEPYFTHTGITPQRIHPFVVTVPPAALDAPDAQFLPFYQLMLLRGSLSKDTHMMAIIARTYRYLNTHLGMDRKISTNFAIQKSMEHHNPTFSLPLSYHRAPSLPDLSEQITSTVIANIKPKKSLFGSQDKPKRQVKLQETQPPEFDGIPKKSNSISKIADQAADKIKTLTKPFLKKPNPATTPQLAKDFDKELDRFIHDLDDLDEHQKPTPEKW